MNKYYYLTFSLLIITLSLFRFQQLEGASPYLEQAPVSHNQKIEANSNGNPSLLKSAKNEITVTVDWDNIIREIPQYAYGVNSPANLIPAFSNDVTFMRNLEFITQKKGFIRLHGWGMLGDSPDALFDDAWQENGTWDSTKINQALRPLVDEGYTIMINIPSGPKGEDDYQNPSRFAKFCSDLVKIVNIDHQLGIKYWEIPNERELGFIEPGLSISEMSALIQAAGKAMKAIDPSIKVGGPASSWVNVEYISELVKQTYPNIDFISVHSYTGDGSNSLQNAYDIAQFATDDLAEIRTRVDSITGDNYLPLFLTEYNIAFQGSPWIFTHQGAVYDAIMLTQSIIAGADATMFWNVAPYSDMSLLDGDNRNQNTELFKTFNQSFHGKLVKSQSADATKIISYAVSSQATTDRYAFALINRTPNLQTIKLDFKQWFPSDLKWHLWDSDNSFVSRSTNWDRLNKGRFDLTPYSVNLFVSDKHRATPASDKSGGGSLPIWLLVLVYFCKKGILSIKNTDSFHSLT